jgi:hypothetical protein
MLRRCIASIHRNHTVQQLPRTNSLPYSRLAHPAAFPLAAYSRMSSSFPSTPPVYGTSFRIALIQLGGVTDDKAANLIRAKAKIMEAVKGDGGAKVGMVVLPVSILKPKLESYH